MSRSRLVFLLTLLVVPLGAAAPATAQQMDRPNIPIGADLKKVPAGSWADYNLTMSGMPMGPMKVRYTLVSKDAKGLVLENTSDTPMGRMAFQMQMAADPTQPNALKKAIMQLGEGDPMEMPIGGATGKPQGFEKPNAANLVGEEKLTIGGSTYKTKHYRTKDAKIGTIDTWISPDVPPLGLVKLELTPAPGSPSQQAGKVTQELLAKGGGGKSTITKPAKPFDPAALGGLMGGQQGGRGAAGPGAKPGAAPAAPAPARK